MSFNLKHISLAELADLAEDRNTAGGERLNVHLSTCNTCSTALSRLRDIFALMRDDNSEDAPRDLLANAIGLFQSARSERPSSLGRKILAVLSFDSLNSAPAFGTRSGIGESRQLLYSADESDIDLHITGKGDGWIVSGQILGGACEGGQVELEGESVVERADLNETCEFNLPVVPSGEYKLVLRLPDLEVEVTRLELRK